MVDFHCTMVPSATTLIHAASGKNQELWTIATSKVGKLITRAEIKGRIEASDFHNRWG